MVDDISALADENIVFLVVPAGAPFGRLSGAAGIDMVVVSLESVADVEVSIATALSLAVVLEVEAVAIPAFAALGAGQLGN